MLKECGQFSGLGDEACIQQSTQHHVERLHLLRAQSKRLTYNAHILRVLYIYTYIHKSILRLRIYTLRYYTLQTWGIISMI